MTQVAAVLLITRDSGADVVYASEDLPSGCVWHSMPKEPGYWTFRGDMFGSSHALVGNYSPTTADDLAGFGMAIPDGLLGFVEEPWINGDISPVQVGATDTMPVSDEFLVAYLAQGQHELLPEMVITTFRYDVHRWYLPNDAIVVAWKALPDFPVGML